MINITCTISMHWQDIVVSSLFNLFKYHVATDPHIRYRIASGLSTYRWPLNHASGRISTEVIPLRYRSILISGNLQRELYFNLECIAYYAKPLCCTSLFLGSLMAHVARGEQRQKKLPALCNEANTHDQRFPRIKLS